jgi:tRNA nucleotidyltransferase/poly(A) polymerase
MKNKIDKPLSLFQEFLLMRETKEPVVSKVKLQKNAETNEFAPLTIDKNNHSNLRILIKAFEESPKIGLGYTTIQKGVGEIEPQLKKKTVYLTGGAVRDHLKGKTPRNYDLVTDATISEIRMILDNSDYHFTEIKPKELKFSKKYKELPENAPGKTYYVSRWDKEGKELEVTININKQVFEISPLSKTDKSRRIVPDKAEMAGSIEQDAANRDFTINALYIPLTNSDGDNADLIDPFGGIHHIANNEVVPIGDFKERLKTEPLTGSRYIKFVSRFGKNAPNDIINNIKTVFSNLDDRPKEINQEFMSGLDNSDTDPKKYINLYKKTGLLNLIFPDVEFDDEFPEDFKNDKFLSTAWLLRNLEPEKVKKILVAGGWKPQEACDISYLVCLYNWGKKNNYDPRMFYDIKKTISGLSKNKIREWLEMCKLHGKESHAFLNHDDSDIKGKIYDDMGKMIPNPEYTKFLDGKNPSGHDYEVIKRILSTNKFMDSIR